MLGCAEYGECKVEVSGGGGGGVVVQEVGAEDVGSGDVAAECRVCVR